MAKPTNERAREYRARLALRASFFNALNDHRIAGMDLSIGSTTPEERAVREMCLNLPHVRVAPSEIGWPGPGPYIEVAYLDPTRRPRLEDMAAAYAALREITSAPVQMFYITDEGAGQPDEEALKAEAGVIAAEVRQLRDAGMWFKK